MCDCRVIDCELQSVRRFLLLIKDWDDHTKVQAYDEELERIATVINEDEEGDEHDRKD